LSTDARAGSSVKSGEGDIRAVSVSLVADARASLIAENGGLRRAAVWFPVALASASVLVEVRGGEVAFADVDVRALAVAVEPVPDLSGRAVDLLAGVVMTHATVQVELQIL